VKKLTEEMLRKASTTTPWGLEGVRRGDELREEIFRTDNKLVNEEKLEQGCVLIQAGAFVKKGKGVMMVGSETIDMMESFSRFPDVDGIMSNGKGLILDPNNGEVYPVHTEKEIGYCYKTYLTSRKIPFIQRAELSDLAVIHRSFKNQEDFQKLKEKRGFSGNEYLRGLLPSSNRLKSYFLDTACHVDDVNLRRPGYFRKELRTSKREDVKKALDKIEPRFLLGYTTWFDGDNYVVVGQDLARGKINPFDRMAQLINQEANKHL
jgi:hypothetical protein